MIEQPIVQVFYNPVAGSFSGPRLDALIEAFRKEGAEVITTPSVNATPSVHPSTTHICIAGGDGTLRHVAMMLVAAQVRLPVAVYPMGTINLLAREYVADFSAGFAARSLLHGPATRRTYPVTLGDTMFLVCASVGPDSLAVAQVSTVLKARIGRAAYAVALLKVLLNWPRPKITLCSDDGTYTCEAVYIAKGRFYAGPWSFAPQARGDDERLHAVALKTARRRDFARFIADLWRGKDPSLHANTFTFTCTKLSITSDRPAPIQADGDPVAALPATAQVCTDALTLCDRPTHQN